MAASNGETVEYEKRMLSGFCSPFLFPFYRLATFLPQIYVVYSRSAEWLSQDLNLTLNVNIFAAAAVSDSLQ